MMKWLKKKLTGPSKAARDIRQEVEALKELGVALQEIDLKETNAAIKNMLNHGINVCCDKCHSTDYDIYPTPCVSWDPDDDLNDIWFKCEKCGHKWPSGFIKKGGEPCSY
jgi:hypothetical protein